MILFIWNIRKRKIHREKVVSGFQGENKEVMEVQLYKYLKR
jgi:hypothetical protein